MSLTGALFVGRSGIATSQAALEVVGNNMANAANEDYVRRTAALVSLPSQEAQPGAQIGTGEEYPGLESQTDGLPEKNSFRCWSAGSPACDARFRDRDEKGVVKEYINEEVKVIWKPDLCTHSRKCYEGLPDVFQTTERPWVKIDGATSDEIIDQVVLCPSKALSYERMKKKT